MLGINVRFTASFLVDLQYAADRERRTLRQFIRNALRSELAGRGYLDYYDVAPAIVLASANG